MGVALLVNPSYHRTYGSNEGGLAFPVFPVLGLASLGGAARDHGHDVHILDLSYRAYAPELIEAAIRELQPDVIGVTATTPLMNQARDISFIAQQVRPAAITVLGGAHPSALPRTSLQESAFDLVAGGEADTTVARLLDGDDPASIPGVWHRCEGAIVAPEHPTPLLDDLDALPLPAWERYPMDGNRRITRLLARHLPVTVIEFSRGCIYGCDFCASKNTLGRGYRKKSPERCAEEMARTASLGFREVVVVDDIFTTDRNWAAAVCEEIIRRRIDIAWTCSNGIRVDAADPELFALMRRAGCYRAYFGFESGSEAVLRSFGKGGRASLAKGIEAVQLAKDAGLEPNGFFLVGLSGDTEETIEETIEYAKKLPIDSMKCGICVPFPGTPMFAELYDQGRIKTLDWDQYTVYNRAERIFDHPTLSWDVLQRSFQRFYAKVIARNPSYLARRFRYMVRHREVLWHVYYTAKFWRLIWGRQRETERERYAHDGRWRELDAVLGEPLERVPLAIVRRRGTVRSGEPAGSPSLGADRRDDLGRSAGPSGSATTTTTPSPA